MSSKLLDTNILVYAVNTNSEFYKKSQDLVRLHKFFTTSQNIIETYRVITSIDFYNPQTKSQAKKYLQTISQLHEVLYPTQETTEQLFDLLGKHKINSYQIFDANLVAIMIENNIDTIITNNEKDFKKFKSIKIENPFK